MGRPRGSALFRYRAVFRSGFEDESEERVPPRRGVEESDARGGSRPLDLDEDPGARRSERATSERAEASDPRRRPGGGRSEEHTSELQSRQYLVCRLLLEKK